MSSVLLPALSDVFKGKLSITSLLWEIFGVVMPRVAARGLWMGLANGGYTPIEQRVGYIRSLEFESKDVELMLSVCRSHGTTIHGLLSACLVVACGMCAAQDEAYSFDHISFKTMTAVDMRPYISCKFVACLAQLLHSGSPTPLREVISSALSPNTPSVAQRKLISGSWLVISDRKL